MCLLASTSSIQNNFVFVPHYSGKHPDVTFLSRNVYLVLQVTLGFYLCSQVFGLRFCIPLRYFIGSSSSSCTGLSLTLGAFSIV